MLVLGIESSCDETAVALFDSEQQRLCSLGVSYLHDGIIGHTVHSQTTTHEKYGGVVPELASRDHIQKIHAVVQTTLEEASVSKKDIDLVAYTKGPGLMGGLFVGSMFAAGFAYGLGIPTLGVHHMQAHLMAAKLCYPKLEFPFITLLVSGGHSMIVLAESLNSYRILGQSLDDAAGEALDKAAKMLEIGFPGGALLEKSALLSNNKQRFTFPKPMVDRPGLDLSFSGLKTACLNAINAEKKNETFDKECVNDIAYAFQEAVMQTLKIKIRRAIEQTGCKRVVVAGGVSANQLLRFKFSELKAKYKAEFYFPKLSYCTDNGAMVAYLGYELASNKWPEKNYEISVSPRWSLEHLSY